jgi:hypothetical protein
MNLFQANFLNARPHPGPLPRGEGELFAGSRKNSRLVLPDGRADRRSHSITAPSPGGEGQGEGGRSIRKPNFLFHIRTNP